MVVVVLGRKVKRIHKSHRLLQSRMQRGHGGGFDICKCHFLDQGAPGSAEPFEEQNQRLITVAGGMGARIAHVRRGQYFFSAQKIIYATRPQIFQVAKMPYLFFYRPFPFRSGGKDFIVNTSQHDLEAKRGAAQPFQDNRKKSDREVEGKAPFDPGNLLNHDPPFMPKLIIPSHTKIPKLSKYMSGRNETLQLE